MATTVDEYTQGWFEDVELPSGHIFTIKTDISMWDFYTGAELAVPNALPPDNKTPPTPEQALRMKKMAAKAIASCVYRPRFTNASTPEGDPIEVPGYIHVERFAFARTRDYDHLLSILTEKAGLTKEVAADADSFRQDDISEGGESARTGIPEAAPRDYEVQPSGVLLQPGGDVAGDDRAEQAPTHDETARGE